MHKHFLPPEIKHVRTTASTFEWVRNSIWVPKIFCLQTWPNQLPTDEYPLLWLSREIDMSTNYAQKLRLRLKKQDGTRGITSWCECTRVRTRGISWSPCTSSSVKIGDLAVCPLKFIIVRNSSFDFDRRLKNNRELLRIVYHHAMPAPPTGRRQVRYECTWTYPRWP